MVSRGSMANIATSQNIESMQKAVVDTTAFFCCKIGRSIV